MILAEKSAAPRSTAFIEYHADDFGLFPRQSQRILGCCHHGKLNGVSVMPNGENLKDAMALLAETGGCVAVTVHLNLFEGKCMTSPRAGLTDEDGTLCASFPWLLLHSWLPGRKAHKNWLKEELRAQIRAVANCLPEGSPLRLDSHAHYHMLPIVFDALMEVIEEDALPVSYIRIPREYPMLYLRHIAQLHDLSLINLAKVAVLNILAVRNTRKYARYLAALEKRVFLGVFLSGRMYRENVDPILPDAIALAKRKGWGLEILAHPGGVAEAEDIAKLTDAGDVAFLTSPLRKKEASLFDADIPE